MRFFENARPAKGDYFEIRDYTKKWRNLSADKVPKEWQGSQLSDTAYAAREVQEYLEAALWPEEPGHLEGGQRRIFVTRGGHTARLRRDWQLYRQADPNELPPGPEEQERRDAKNRGDHREHAIDAVAIALTSESRLQKMAKDVNDHNDAWTQARRTGQRPKQLRRKPLPPPWGDVQSFRQQVMSLIYPTGTDESSSTPLVVSHRAVGRKLSGQLHEESLFGPVAHQENTFIAKKAIGDLTPKHLRMQVAEKPNDAIARLAKRYQQADRKLSAKDAKARAKKVVEGRGYQPRMVDPSPEKSGLIRDIGLRRVLRKQITERAEKLGLPRDADSFTKSDLKKMLAEPFGPFRQESGVPIKSFRLLRTMNRPVVMTRREFDYETMQWTQLDSKNNPTSPRVHLSGNNHHLEIRRNLRGKWVGTVVSMYEAARRAKKLGVAPVDRTSDDDRGTYVMSLAIGETVYMRDKETNQPGYFVVTKLDSESNRVFLCAHWDARRSVGEKNESGLVAEGTKRRTLPYPPSKMQSLAPPGYDTPVKVSVSPIGQITVVEPHEPRTVDLNDLDAEVVAIAREAIAARESRNAENRKGRRSYGSWSWMRERLRKCDKDHLAAELSSAMRALTSDE